MLTRKHFQLIADAIAETHGQVIRTIPTSNKAGLYAASDALRAVAHKLADSLASTNPNFDRERFLAATVRS